MAPFLIGNIASAALGALSGSSDSKEKKDPFDDLVSKLQQTGSGEKTVSKSDGSSVTTVTTASGGERIVSETSASGQTLTEAGYVSPTLVQKFLDNLFSSLKADGAAVSGSVATSASSAAGKAAATTASTVSSAVDKLGAQLSTGASGTAGLVNSFGNLLQSSGINLPDGTSASSALKSFLAHAAPAIESGQITRTGINVRA